MNNGKLYIISAPSGAGKTTLVKQLISDLDNLTVSISHTTRPMRTGETNGQDYYFITIEDFQAMQEKQAFLEYAQVFDNFYGTAQQTLEQNLKKGSDVILEIDWQGAQQVKKLLPDSISIFILPPSTEVLLQRLRNRGQDDEQIIARRMRDAVAEIRHYEEFDYLVVNNVFEQALTELKSIVIANRLSRQRQLHNLRPLLTALLS
ncbi:guanylate kinase [Candidatus Methylobacter favarea]|uniref:Guanylate kinase n=1 Tax=Candidatus Methylobacter favarea TaxID=2707345 RepID=A0A8S0XGS1_9GAMM|nr:guanylate kinase [Candidatus Methylobacter favarea]CAA9891277.1 guanylate kinase [Candidatus Methylobacter favarea]